MGGTRGRAGGAAAKYSSYTNSATLTMEFDVLVAVADPAGTTVVLAGGWHTAMTTRRRTSTSEQSAWSRNALHKTFTHAQTTDWINQRDQSMARFHFLSLIK